jgi:hypothetical protein
VQILAEKPLPAQQMVIFGELPDDRLGEMTLV